MNTQMMPVENRTPWQGGGVMNLNQLNYICSGTVHVYLSHQPPSQVQSQVLSNSPDTQITPYFKTVALPRILPPGYLGC